MAPVAGAPGTLLGLPVDLTGGGERNFGHGDGAPGMNSDIRAYPDLGYVVIGLSNLDPPAAERLTGFYAARMPLQR